MGFIEYLKKLKRLFDYTWCRKFVITLLLVLVLIKFWYGYIYVVDPNQIARGPVSIQRCLDDRLLPFYHEEEEGNANIYYDVPATEGQENIGFLPLVGNGLFALTMTQSPSLYVKKSRTLSLSVGWSPLVRLVPQYGSDSSEAMVTHFVTGIVHLYNCYSNGLLTSNYIYAHRSRSNILVQEIRIVNPTDETIPLRLVDPVNDVWPSAMKRSVRLFEFKTDRAQHTMISGVVPDVHRHDDQEMVLTVVRKFVPQVLQIEPRKSLVVEIPSFIFTETIPLNTYRERRSSIEEKCIERSRNLTITSFSALKQEHMAAWFSLWESGLSISYSKASGVLNGNKINATIYYVLSNVLLHNNASCCLPNSTNVLPKRAEYLSAGEGCYGGYHHTLQANSLWKDLKTFKEVNDAVSLWLLTLEKQGCHKLIITGAFGVLQAMILSFGGFRFSSQHLEFKIDPKFLHRDYLFRRIRYNDRTCINVTVTLQDDNKAQLGVALDRSDKPYYACDGGCIDEPVQLKSTPVYFPVKVTDPITSILYITSDRSHMELIKDTLHVHKIVEAPAYDHHVIALHKHGHHLGGLPVLFWASICFLIIVFHLFLFKLIFNEYCDKQDRHKARYGKMSL
ncbi:Uncharacterized conserved protein (DUF2152) [Nesidiocoris tenuis]|uniref:Uncharacterized conserved protein (DUF2152) n=1 Tax=Nesidiocoris tenuis TaxID=355587 RepID=A0ABN7ADS1_9HEMI|nr:Uncharacterized conserved protein (DUF2152) [Nesidiocoris tenuis]